MSNNKKLKLPPEIAAAGMKILNANGKGMIQLNPAEANWLTNIAGMHVGQMKAAQDAGKVMLKDKAEFEAQMHGLAILSNKAQKALHELMDDMTPPPQVMQ